MKTSYSFTPIQRRSSHCALFVLFSFFAAVVVLAMAGGIVKAGDPANPVLLAHVDENYPLGGGIVLNVADAVAVRGDPVYVVGAGCEPSFCGGAIYLLDASDRMSPLAIDAVPYVGGTESAVLVHEPFVYATNEFTGAINPAIGSVVMEAMGLNPVGDIVGDGSVSVSDLLILLASWGPSSPKGEWPADLDGNGSVGVPDLLASDNTQPGWVLSHQKISDTEGGFTGVLDDADEFGLSAASLGDLDGDGVGDLAVGAPADGDGGAFHGAVWVLFLNTDGTVKSHQKISDTEGGFTGNLDDSDLFGVSVASLGDLDGDGVGDLAVGAPLNDDGNGRRGAVWVLFLNTNGTVKSHQKISDTQGGFTGILDVVDLFGASVASLGDLDGDGVGDLAVGAHGDDDGGLGRGAVWVLFLNTDGTVKSHQKISDFEGGFTGILDTGDLFGWSVASLGDLDGNGVGDLAVGATLDDDGGFDRGAVWVLFLNTNGTVNHHQKISDTEGGFTGILDDGDRFGSSLASLGDLDGDGVADLAVGAPRDDDRGLDRGAVWVLFLNTDGIVISHQKISDTEGGFAGILDDSDRFGGSVASLGDLDGDGVGDLAVGASLDDDGGDALGGPTTNRGAVWVLFLDGICLWDLDGSGDIGVKDLLILLGAWGPNKGHPADFDNSGDVGVKDLLVLLGVWGPCP